MVCSWGISGDCGDFGAVFWDFPLFGGRDGDLFAWIGGDCVWSCVLERAGACGEQGGVCGWGAVVFVYL